MNCEKCGAPLEEGVKFCPSCGAAIEAATEPVFTAEPLYTSPEPEQPVLNGVPTTNSTTTYTEEAQPTGKGLAIASMVCGILSIVLCCFTYVSVILSVVAIVLGIVSKKKTTEGSGMALAGIITGAAALLITVFILILGAAMGAAFGGMSPEEVTQYLKNI